jgi:hypothetical protein
MAVGCCALEASTESPRGHSPAPTNGAARLGG